MKSSHVGWHAHTQAVYTYKHIFTHCTHSIQTHTHTYTYTYTHTNTHTAGEQVL